MRRRDLSVAFGTVCLGLLFLPGGEIRAADLSVRAPVGAVTVFPDRAEVTRVIQATVPAGATTLVLEGLPATLLPDSVRVSGTAGDKIAIGSVETKPLYRQDAVNAEERRLLAEIETLNDKRRALSDKISALQVQVDFIASIGREMPAAANEEIIRGTMDPAKWQQAWQALSAGTAEARDGMRLAEIEMRGIDAEVQKKHAELAQIQTGQTASMVARVNIDAQQGTTVKLELSYQLGDAWWWPVYDARLNTDSGKIDLVQMAQVQQRTGEDWSNVKLTLSTAQPSMGAVLPDLQTWFLLTAQEFKQKAAGAGQNTLDDLYKDELNAPSPAAPPMISEEGDGRRDAELLRANLVASEFAAQYGIPGTASVPSDDSAHKFVIAAHSMTGKLAVRTVPKIAPTAHLF
ncbi:MAG TPA: mucoidy inhibitor MuiA family protein, partial [Dongiaceae bacterium]